VEERTVPFDKLIETYTLPDINEAIAAAAAGSVIKPVIVFD
jgi:aryl-alcohol dehydrogenase